MSAAPRPPDFSNVTVLVAGDVMADIYWSGSASRISPEAPVPVVRIESEELKPGGAANVALNITSLGARCTLLGVVGDDSTADELSRYLEARDVSLALLRVAGFPTTRKLRVMSRRQQLVRLDFEDLPTACHTESKIERARNALLDADLVVLSDYAKGFLGRDTAALIALARAEAKPVIVDPKGVDFDRYAGATLLTPNLAEFESIVGRCDTDTSIVERGNNLRERLGLRALLITRGEKGMTLVTQGQCALHLPSRAREVYDVTGAGDTVVATIATALGAGMPLDKAVELSNVAAGIVVGKSGTATTCVAEILDVVATPEGESAKAKILDQRSLKQLTGAAKSSGKTVVMTNGCFDVLHAGHIDLLRRAKQLGNILVVAVNSDASVRRLKGPNRPVNPLTHRLAILEMLECVDHLVVFEDDTPEKLYCDILPQILVKGGDYSAASVAGGQCVTAAGGKVVILDLVPGLSTTGILAKLGSAEP